MLGKEVGLIIIIIIIIMIIGIKSYIKSLKSKIYLVIRKRDEHTTKFMENLKTLNEKGMPKIIILNEDVKVLGEREKAKSLIVMNDYPTLPTAGHAGIQRTINTLKQKYTWPGIDKDVRDMTAKCKHCQL